MGTPCARNSGIVKPLSSEQVSYETINSNYDTIDASLAKGKWDATVDPAVTDDSGDGYAIGSIWVNATGNKIFIAKSVAVGAAVWRQIWPALLADQALAADWDAGNYEIRAKTFESDVATGAAPLTVASTTKVANLNCDKLDDLEGAAFAILAGQSGGQTLEGDTASGGNLTLKSTHHATKGKILFGTSAYDEVNNRLGIGAASPSYPIHVIGTCFCSDAYPGYQMQSTGSGAKVWAILSSAGDLLIRNNTDGVNIIHIYNSGGMSLGSSVVDPGANNLYVTGDVNCASVTDHTPAYEGDAVKEIQKIKNVDGTIDHTSLPSFCQKKFVDVEGKEKIGRDLGATISILVEAVKQLTARIEALEGGA